MKRLLAILPITVTVALGAMAEPTALIMQLDLPVENAQFAGLLVAERDGFYKASALDVTLKPLGGGIDYPSVAETVAASDHMVGSIESGLFLAGRAKGLRIVAIGAMFQQTPLCLMSFRSSGIRAPADLKGKRLIIHGDGHEALDDMLRGAGIGHAELTITEGDYGNEALLSHRCDAQQGYLIDELVELQARGLDIVALPFGSYGYAAYSQVYFVSERTLALHREALVRFIAASNRGWRKALADVDGTARYIVRDHAPQLSLDYQRRSLAAIGPLLTCESRQMGVTSRATWLKNAEEFRTSQPGSRLGPITEWADFSVAEQAALISP